MVPIKAMKAIGIVDSLSDATKATKVVIIHRGCPLTDWKEALARVIPWGWSVLSDFFHVIDTRQHSHVEPVWRGRSGARAE
jgi:hypothetical protein